MAKPCNASASVQFLGATNHTLQSLASFDLVAIDLIYYWLQRYALISDWTFQILNRCARAQGSMARLEGANDTEKLHNLEARSYKDQAIHFLNAFWDAWGSDAEKLWQYVHKCNELDLQRHADGCALDEVNAHRFLELLHETLTVMAMRERLRKTGALGPTERPKVVPLTHYLLFKYIAFLPFYSISLFLLYFVGDNKDLFFWVYLTYIISSTDTKLTGMSWYVNSLMFAAFETIRTNMQQNKQIRSCPINCYFLRTVRINPRWFDHETKIQTNFSILYFTAPQYVQICNNTK